jgi:hypothetical protein
MSADTPASETKYETGRRSTLVEDDVALTNHALNRYRERTPHDRAVGIREAYRRGEDIDHPAVAGSPDDPRAPKRARVYKHGDRWGVVFLIVEEHTPAAERPAHHTADHVVTTVIHLAGYEHGPSRAYLHSHGPHDGGDSA